MKRFLWLFLLIPLFSDAQIDGVKHVIVFGVDGLGADYLKRAVDIPHIKKMMQEGSYTFAARNVLPTSSAVNWAAMTMGASPSLTGYTEWNSRTPEIPSKAEGKYGIFPTIFELLHEQRPDSKIDIIYTWEGIGYLFPKQVADTDIHTNNDSLTITRAIAALAEEKPTLLFLHFDNVDHAGHTIGWGTPAYYTAIHEIDQKLGEMMKAIRDNGMEDNTILLLTADHGGINKGHGGKSIQEVEIPWIITGKGIKKYHELQESIMTFDTASTIAYIFGLKQPQVWIGRPVLTAFEK